MTLIVIQSITYPPFTKKKVHYRVYNITPNPYSKKYFVTC